MNEKSKINMNLFFLSRNKNIIKDLKLEKNTNKNKAKKSSKELQEIWRQKQINIFFKTGRPIYGKYVGSRFVS